MNQVEQSVAEYVDEVWEDVVADIEQLDGAERRAAEEGLCVRVRSLPQVRHHPLSKR